MSRGGLGGAGSAQHVCVCIGPVFLTVGALMSQGRASVQNEDRGYLAVAAASAYLLILEGDPAGLASETRLSRSPGRDIIDIDSGLRKGDGRPSPRQLDGSG